MAIASSSEEQTLSYGDLFKDFTHQLLESFKTHDFDFNSGTTANFSVKERVNKNKINPVIRYANNDDIEDIISIYKDIYGASYPYKEMLDPEEIRKKLASQEVEWLLFETKSGESAGTITFDLDFKKKLGYARGFNMKRKYFGKIDSFKACVGSFVAMYHKYNNKIFRWYAENRTVHAKSQYAFSAAGLRPVAFFPSKDVFFGERESDIFMISYDHKALNEMRSLKVPHIIPEALNSYLFSNRNFQAGSYQINAQKLHYDRSLVYLLGNKIVVKKEQDKYGYEKYCLSINDSDSYFKFLYTPSVNNFEKTEYKINCLEELFVFLKKFKELGQKLNVKYSECFVSAYEPEHQRLFQNMGFSPGGYVPSWFHDPISDKFEDSILFNHSHVAISQNIELLEEGFELLDYLGFKIFT